MTSRAVVAAMTCHNRKATTLAALEAFFAQAVPPDVRLGAVLVDDGSRDGTADAVQTRFPQVRVVTGNGSLWWGGAIRLAADTAVRQGADDILWLNDDVVLDADSLARMLAVQRAEGGIVAGATRDPATGLATYGGQRRTRHPFGFVTLDPAPTAQRCDTFHGNAVLVPRAVFASLGGISPLFDGVQGMADTDFGLRATALGISIHQAPGTVGVCQKNSVPVPWRDARLTTGARLAALVGPRGYPVRAWLAFARRHAGKAWPLWLAATYLLAIGRAVFAAQPIGADGKLRIAMLEGSLPSYRAEQLALLSSDEAFEILVFAGKPARAAPGSKAPDGFPLPLHYGRNLYWLGDRERIAWSHGSCAVVRGGYDVASLGLHLHDVGIWTIWLWRQIVGRPRIAFVGHFRLAGAGLKPLLRRILARSADAVLPYTDGGAAACRAARVDPDRIFVVHNALDMDRLAAARGSVTAADCARLRTRLGLGDGAIFLFVGTLYRDKRVDLAAHATARLRARGYDCALLIVGDGSEAGKLAAAFPPGGGVHFLAAERDERRLAALFASATAVVVPDAAGLVVVHALGYGVPVVASAAGRHHGPELEYLETGANALLTDRLDAEALAQAMAQLCDDPGLRERLAAGARATAATLGVARMAAAIADGLRRAAAP